MIDNFELIKSLLFFDNEYQFYFLQIIQRKKDFKEITHCLGTNNNSRLIKAYYIYSKEQFDKYKGEIISLCHIFHARAGISLNKRDNRIVSLEMLELLARDIRVGNYGCISKIYNSVCGSTKGTDKIWLIDVDNKNVPYIEKMASDLCSIEPSNTDKVLATIPTLSGVHLITRPFNSQKFGELYLEAIHKNNPTLIYYNENI